MLSQQELLAERMYELFRTGKMGHKSFIYNFRKLAEEEKIYQFITYSGYYYKMLMIISIL